MTSAYVLVNALALTEAEYREKHGSFAVDAAESKFEEHPGERYRVLKLSGVRECDIKDGDVSLLAFYDGEDLIRSYSLKQLFPDRADWKFHPATGVFLWTLFNPKTNGFHGKNYTVLTVSGERTFDVATAEQVTINKKENKSEMATPRKPSD